MGMAIGMDQTRWHFGTPDSQFLLGKTGIDINGLLKALREAEASGVPVALIGATSAYVYFFQACRRKKMTFCLPPGSRVCDGGGYRGRFGVVDPRRLLRRWSRRCSACPSTLRQRAGRGRDGHQPLRRRPAPPREGAAEAQAHPAGAAVVAGAGDGHRRPAGRCPTARSACWRTGTWPTCPPCWRSSPTTSGYTTDGGTGCEMVGRAKIENGKVSPLPDERPAVPMGDSAIFRMLERYVNFSIDLKMRSRQGPEGLAPSMREEIEARPGSVASCPQVVDEILVSQTRP